MEDPSTYPRDYINVHYGLANYWYDHSNPINRCDWFVPQLKEKPYVRHPHQHPEYLRTFLNTPQIKTCSNYMYPKFEHYNNTITLKQYRTICATDVSFQDCSGYTGVLLKSFHNRNLIKKRCAEYIMFHSCIKKRIPYDSEIVNFVHRWLQIDQKMFDTPEQYHTLCVRIHDCACLIYFGIKLVRNKIPGHKPHSWQNRLNQDTRHEILDDPTLGLTPVQQDFRKKNAITKSLKKSPTTMTIASTKNVDTSYYGPSPNDTSYNAPSNNDPFNSHKKPVIQVQPDSNRVAKNTKRKESRKESHLEGNSVSKKAKIMNVTHSAEEE